MEIVFVRHAEKREGDEDSELSQKGIEQAKNLAKRIGKEHFDELYCSSLQRAVETARFISEEISLSPKIEPSLNEFESNLLKIKEEE